LDVWSVWVALVCIALTSVALGLHGSFPTLETYVACKAQFCDTWWDIRRDRNQDTARLIVYAMLSAAALGPGVLWLHFKRSRHAPLAYICWLPTAALLPLCIGLYPVSLWLLMDVGVPTLIIRTLMQTALPLLGLVFMLSAFGLVYFLRSREVRETFVR